MSTASSSVKPVDFAPIIEHISQKVLADREQLIALYNDNIEGIRNYAAQDVLTAEIQAGLRAIDVLSGACDLIGANQPLKPVASLPRVDFDAMERALRGGDQQHQEPEHHEQEGTGSAETSAKPPSLEPAPVPAMPPADRRPALDPEG